MVQNSFLHRIVYNYSFCNIVANCKMELNLAGLGKRRIKFLLKNSNHEQVRETLESVFPKLKTQNGAKIEFMHAE